MALNTNISSTDGPYFQIGKNGVTLYQGNSIPDNNFGRSGDVFFKLGAEPQLLFKNNNIWEELGKNQIDPSIYYLINDPNPTLGSHLDTNGFNITSSSDINIIPNDNLILNDNVFPKNKGLSGQILKADGNGNIVWDNINSVSEILNSGNDESGTSIISSQSDNKYYLKRILAGSNIGIRSTNDSIVIDGVFSDLPNASINTKGIIQIATTAEIEVGTDDTKAITPAKLKPSIESIVSEKITEAIASDLPDATTTTKGIIQIASLDEVEAGTDENKAVTPSTLKPSVESIVSEKIGEIVSGDIPDATTTTKGIIQIATEAEVNRGADNTKAITPATFNPVVNMKITNEVGTIYSRIEGLELNLEEATTLKRGTVILARSGDINPESEGFKDKVITPELLYNYSQNWFNNNIPTATITDFKTGTSDTLILTPASIPKGKEVGDVVIVGENGKIDPDLIDANTGLSFNRLEYPYEVSFDDEIIINHKGTDHKITLNYLKSLIRSNTWWEQNKNDSGPWYPTPPETWSSEYTWLASFGHTTRYTKPQLYKDKIYIDGTENVVSMYNYMGNLQPVTKTQTVYNANGDMLGWHFNTSKKCSAVTTINTDILSVTKKIDVDLKNIRTVEYTISGNTTLNKFSTVYPISMSIETGPAILSLRGEIMVYSLIENQIDDGVESIDIILTTNTNNDPTIFDDPSLTDNLLYVYNIPYDNFKEPNLIDVDIEVNEENMIYNCYVRLRTITTKQIYLIISTRGLALYSTDKTLTTKPDFIIPTSENSFTFNVNSCNISDFIIPPETEIISYSFSDGNNLMVPYTPENIGDGVILKRDDPLILGLNKSDLYISRIDALKISKSVDEYDVIDVLSFYGETNNASNAVRLSDSPLPYRDLYFPDIHGNINNTSYTNNGVCADSSSFFKSVLSFELTSFDIPKNLENSGLIVSPEFSTGVMVAGQHTYITTALNNSNLTEPNFTFSTIPKSGPLDSEYCEIKIADGGSNPPPIKDHRPPPTYISFIYEYNNESGVLLNDYIEFYAKGDGNIIENFGRLPTYGKKQCRGIIMFRTSGNVTPPSLYMSARLRRTSWATATNFLKINNFTYVTPSMAHHNIYTIGRNRYGTQGINNINFTYKIDRSGLSTPYYRDITHVRFIFTDDTIKVIPFSFAINSSMNFSGTSLELTETKWIKRIEFCRERR